MPPKYYQSNIKKCKPVIYEPPKNSIKHKNYSNEEIGKAYKIRNELIKSYD